MRLLLALSAVLATTAAPPVVAKAVTVKVGPRSFQAVLAYPSRRGRYPIVAFAHGYTASPVVYGTLIIGLVRRGYVVIAPASELGQSPVHSRLAGDLNLALAWLATGHGVPKGRADGSRRALLGHSMGGGVALLAASRNRAADAVATLSAAETQPSALTAARRLRVPSLFVVGSQDQIVPPASTRLFYAAAPRPSLFATLRGGSHCGVIDDAALACGTGSLAAPRQLSLTLELLGRWLDHNVAHRPAAAVNAVRGFAFAKK